MPNPSLAIGSDKPSLTTRIVHRPEVSHVPILGEVPELLADAFGITHVTVQCKVTPCEETDEDFHFASAKPSPAEHAGHIH